MVRGGVGLGGVVCDSRSVEVGVGSVGARSSGVAGPHVAVEGAAVVPLGRSVKGRARAQVVVACVGRCGVGRDAVALVGVRGAVSSGEPLAVAYEAGRVCCGGVRVARVSDARHAVSVGAAAGRFVAGALCVGLLGSAGIVGSGAGQVGCGRGRGRLAVRRAAAHPLTARLGSVDASVARRVARSV